MLNYNAIEKYKKLVKEKWLLPIQVSSFFQKKVDEEVMVLWHENGPLTRMVYPNNEKISLILENEFDDWVDDRSNMPIGLEWKVLRKYNERMLYLPISFCASNCQYCFRQDVLDEERWKEKNINEISNDLILLWEYINSHSELEEVILSWWDPMILPANKLEEICSFIFNKGLSIRIHTKTISYNPELINHQKIETLSKYKVRLVFHITHPYEICEVVEDKIKTLKEYNIRLYNQFPLLRWINDHHALLIKHLKKLDELGIRNLSIFIPDPIKFSWAFRVSLERIFNIIDNFNWNSPSWINSTRFVMDSNIGKLRREDIRSWDKRNNIVTFERDWKLIEYPDFPIEYDNPWKLEIMLWKNNY